MPYEDLGTVYTKQNGIYDFQIKFKRNLDSGKIFYEAVRRIHRKDGKCFAEFICKASRREKRPTHIQIPLSQFKEFLKKSIALYKECNLSAEEKNSLKKGGSK